MSLKKTTPKIVLHVTARLLSMALMAGVAVGCETAVDEGPLNDTQPIPWNALRASEDSMRSISLFEWFEDDEFPELNEIVEFDSAPEE